MKRGTPRHPKVIALAEQLGIEVFAAAGLLELLWHFTAEFSPAGDIGRHSNAAIAKALFWRGKPDKLIFGLVAAKWVDLTEPDRLVVHDWPQHADDTTHNKLARAKRLFSDGTTPSLKRLPPKDRASAEEFYATPSEEKRAHAERTESAPGAHSGQGLAMAKASVVLGKESVRENPTALVPVSESDGWPKYIGIFLAAGKPLNDLDLEKGLRTWLGMQMADRLSATVDIEAICRATTDVKYIPFPVNHLAGRGWTRAAPSRVLPDPPSKGEKKTTEVLRIMRERQARRAAL